MNVSNQVPSKERPTPLVQQKPKKPELPYVDTELERKTQEQLLVQISGYETQTLIRDAGSEKEGA